MVVDDGNTLNNGDNEEVMVPEQINDNDFRGAGCDKAPFVADIADKLSCVSSVVSGSTVSFLLEIVHSISFDLKNIKKQERSCSDCTGITHRGK